MNLQEIKNIDKEHFMRVYSSRIDVCFERGEGCYLYDLDGKEYIDAFAGIAVNSLGYNHSKLTSTICEISKKVMHCSNVFYVKEQAMLEKKLCEISFADKIFFANSGSEANEGAVKLARRYYKNKGEKKYKVISLIKSFHGRTLAMVAATGQEKYQKPFTPLTDGFVNIPPHDLKALESAIDNETCAVMMELIQGEGGIITMDTEYVQSIRKLCDDNDILLIFDEVQTGIGRTGKMFAYEHYDTTPDIMTLAKGLGGGIPIGAILATDKASAFKPGDHGTTFGGNALACGAAYTVLDAIERDNILANVNIVGDYFKQKLEELSNKYNIISEARGKGLMLGLALNDTSILSYIMKTMLEKGFVIGSAGGVALRFVPPLIFKKDYVDKLIDALNQTFEEME